MVFKAKRRTVVTTAAGVVVLLVAALVVTVFTHENSSSASDDNMVAYPAGHRPAAPDFTGDLADRHADQLRELPGQDRGAQHLGLLVRSVPRARARRSST